MRLSGALTSMCGTVSLARTSRIVLACVLVLAASVHAAHGEPDPCAPPVRLDDGWESAEPASAGFDASALCAVMHQVTAASANLHGVVVERGGRLVAETYRRGEDRSIYSLFARETEFGPTVRHDVRSISKSVVSLLVGVAAGRHALDVHTSVLAFYPQYAALRSPERDAITLEHLLTMSSGLEWHETLGSYGSFRNDETRLYWDWAPYRFVLGRPIVAPPGMRFEYSGGGTAVLADVVVQATHTPLRDFARTALFEPLGIHDWEWVGDPYGRPLAFAGLRMRPRDVAKIGRLVLSHGRWNGQDVVPSDWIDASLAPHIATGDGLSYGYQWWIGGVEWHGTQHRWAAGFGNGGQRLFVVPDLDLVVVVAAGAYNDASIAPVVTELLRRVVATIRD
jgi:CubicO group peptidase (beta-lactamase class C family)